MRIVIVVAVEFYKIVRKYCMEKHILKDGGYSFFDMSNNNVEVICFESGPGEIQAGAGMQYLIAKFDPNIILNIGTCGGLEYSMKMGDVCIVEEVVHTDYDVSCIANTLPGQYIGLSSERIRLNKRLIELTLEYFENKRKISRASLASQDRVINGDINRIDLGEKWKCQICDMEMAGYSLIALKNKVPLVSLKIVSDSIGDNIGWNDNWEDEFDELVGEIIGLTSYFKEKYNIC